MGKVAAGILFGVVAGASVGAIWANESGRVKVFDEKADGGYEQVNGWCVNIDIGSRTVAGCLEPFTENDRTNSSGNRLYPEKDLVYTPNATLGSNTPAILAQLVQKGMVCPEDPSHIKWFPNANEPAIGPTATVDTTGKLELDICIDFEHATSVNDTFKVPLIIKPEFEVPAQKLDYPHRTKECVRTIIRYANLTNDIILETVRTSGTVIDDGVRLPITITANSFEPNTCDMDGLDGAH